MIYTTIASGYRLSLNCTETASKQLCSTHDQVLKIALPTATKYTLTLTSQVACAGHYFMYDIRKGD